MSFTEREKAAETALRHLNKTLYKKLSADIRIDLYGKDVLTWSENEKIEAAAKRSNSEGITELIRALDRRGPRGLDALVEALEEEEGANADLIKIIRTEWPKVPVQETGPPPVGVFGEGRPVHPPIPAETEWELLGNGEWPFPRRSSVSEPSLPIPPPPIEGVDAGKKDVYKMNAKPRGVAVIINNKKFTCGMKDRVGTDVDAEQLTRLFVYLGFHTNRYDNLKGRDFRRRLQDVADLDHSKFDCLIVAILTHGIKGDKVYSTDGDLIDVAEITKYFDGNRCPSLIAKPKVFILQACRGGTFDYGVDLDSTDGPVEESIPEDQMKQLMEEQIDEIIKKTLDETEKNSSGEDTDGGGYSRSSLPTEADFVIAYATLPNFVSWRNSEFGSWFIKALTDTMFESAGKEHFLDMLTEVNRRVAEEFQSKGRNKQMPAPVTMLTRKLYFRPGSYK